VAINCITFRCRLKFHRECFSCSGHRSEQGHDTAWVVSHQFPTMKDWVQSQGSSHGIRDGQSGTGGRVFSESFCFPLSVLIPPIFHSLIYSYHLGLIQLACLQPKYQGTQCHPAIRIKTASNEMMTMNGESVMIWKTIVAGFKVLSQQLNQDSNSVCLKYKSRGWWIHHSPWYEKILRCTTCSPVLSQSKLAQAVMLLIYIQ
jgi:hypothetical protein